MDSDSDHEDLIGDEPPNVVDPYAVLGIERDATADQVRSAYRKGALRCHPDKVAADKRDAAHAQFQELALAYAVLSDPARRRRYDQTGSTAESLGADEDGFSWSDFYRAAFADAVTADAIAAFSEKYKNSDEERADVLAAYTRHRGNMDGVFESVMLSDVLADETRFHNIIDTAIAAGEVKAFAKYTGETAAARKARAAAARREGREAEEYAKELGVHDKLFGPGKGGDAAGNGGASKSKSKGKNKKSKAEDSEAGLAALIQQRQQGRAASFLDNLAAKYGATEPKKKGKNKRKKRPAGEEAEEAEDDDEGGGMPSEEAFQAAAARLKNGKKARR